MSRLILAADRIIKARALIQKARDLPIPPAAEGGKINFSYIAQVKAFLQDARDLIKYTPKPPAPLPKSRNRLPKSSWKPIEPTRKSCISHSGTQSREIQGDLEGE